METLHLNERERTVIYEGGIIVGREEGRAEGRAEGLAEGRAEGLATGRVEGKIAAAKQLMLEYGLSPEAVARSLGIDKEELL